MNNVVKYWDENVVMGHVGGEIDWIFSYLNNNGMNDISYIDIGGNVGKFHEEISKRYRVKKCIIVEPSKTLFDYMTEKFVDDTSVELHNFAISDKDGQFFFIDSAGNAVKHFEENGLDSSINLGLSKISHSQTGATTCYSMDNFLRNICSIPPNEISFIKIDTENSDLQIIKSMTPFFVENNISPFIVFENNYHNDISTEQAIDIINTFCSLCGYEPVSLSHPGDNFILPKKK